MVGSRAPVIGNGSTEAKTVNRESWLQAQSQVAAKGTVAPGRREAFIDVQKAGRR